MIYCSVSRGLPRPAETTATEAGPQASDSRMQTTQADALGQGLMVDALHQGLVGDDFVQGLVANWRRGTGASLAGS